MTNTITGTNQQIRRSAMPDDPWEPPGQTCVELLVDGQSVSRLQIVPFFLRIGAATVRMDGIGGVETDREHRGRGYARLILEDAIEHMRAGNAALTMLYGIRDFYHKFGYTTAGPDHFVDLTHLDRDCVLPAGWTIRAFLPADLPILQRLYDLNTAAAVGAAVRRPQEYIWTHLTNPKEGEGLDECRVAVAPDGAVRAYAWRGGHFWYPRMIEREHPERLAIAEVLADGPMAADAILAACRQWARELSSGREQPFRSVVLAQPPEGFLAGAAALSDATFRQEASRSGGSMARVLDVERLLRALEPELRSRLDDAGVSFGGSLRFITEIGEAVFSGSGFGENADVVLPQATLARLALGAFDPADMIDRWDPPPNKRLRPILLALFPHRHPHMSLPDRF
jgi:GNAT superfamily N-acetyltransferase